MIKYENIVKYWQKKKIKTSAELNAALENYIISFAYHSGKIENDKITYNDTREIFDKSGVVSYTGDLRTLFEISNAKDASNLIFNVFDKKYPINETLIKKIQYELTKNTYNERRYRIGERPGEYKKHDYVTGRKEVGALPEDVSMEINELLDEFSNINNNNILIAASYFHAKFENIHPFADGNGRTGRLLMNYLLIAHNHPLIIVHEEDRKEYYSALEEWDTKQKLDKLIKFLKKQTVKTWEKQIKKQLDR